MDSALRVLVERFESNPFQTRRQMRELLDVDPARFCAAALPFLKEAEGAPAGSGRRFLVTFVAQNGLLMDALMSGEGLAIGDALPVALAAIRLDPGLIDRLALGLEKPDLSIPARERLLAILAAAEPGRLSPALSDARLRSKVALLIGKMKQDTEWLRVCMTERNPRVRANAIESIWGAFSESSLELFRRATRDSAPRVAGNAAYGLYLAKDGSGIRTLLEMAARLENPSKSTAAWVMGQTGDPRFLSVLEPMLRDDASGVRKNSLKARLRIQHSLNRLREAALINAEPASPIVREAGL
ncbi:MAG: HEAT repeat domain-containing protein [Bryobacteraceae bacterium]